MKKRVLSLLLCLCMMLPMISALDLSVFAATEKFTVTNMHGEATTTFTYGEPIMVTPLVGEGKDWIGIAPKGKVSEGSARYKYITVDGAKTAGDTRVGAVGLGLDKAFDIRMGATTDERFDISDIGVGDWTIFWVANNQGAGKYDTASAIDISVTAGPVTVNKTSFVVGEPILVTATKQEQTSTKDKSWYGIVPCDDNGTPKKSFGTMVWRDADGTQDDLRNIKNDNAKTGAFGEAMKEACAEWMNNPARTVDWGGEVSKKHISSLPVGTYWLVYCWSSSTLYVSETVTDSSKIVTHAIQIRIEPCIEVKEAYAYGEPIIVTAHTPAAGCSVFISPKHEDVHTNYWSIRWQTVASAGTNTFDIRQSGTTGNYPHLWELPPGDYSLYMVFAPDDKATAANHATRVNITISGDGPLAPTAAEYVFDKTTGLAGGTLSVTVDADELNDSYNKPTHVITYWGDENGNKLPQYTYIGLRKVTGVTTNITVPPATVIPDEARTLLVYAYNGSGVSDSCIKIDLPADRKVVTEQEKGKLLTSFQIVSDTHTQEPLNSKGQEYQFNKNIARMLEDIKVIDPNSAGIFVAGDAVNDGRVAEYEYLYKLWEDSGISAPLFFTSGNHEWKLGDKNNSYTKNYEEEKDRYLTYVNKFLSAAGRENIKNGLPYYDLWVNGFHYIFLASEAPIRHAYLSDAQLNWLDSMLAEDRDAGRPSFILIHQGLYETIDGCMERQDWDGIIAGDAAYAQWKAVAGKNYETRGKYEARFREIISKYPEAMMFSGHTHWDMTEYNNYYDPTAAAPNALPNYCFNTAAISYLVTGYYDDGESYSYSKGWYEQVYELYGETHLKWDDSKGYYLRVYENCIEIYGREFSSSQWVPNAMYRINKTSAIAPNEHEASKPCGDECIYCGESFTPTTPHTGSPTCSHVCQWCGGAAVPTTNHTGKELCSTVCKDCGEPMQPSQNHSGQYPCSDVCAVCGEDMTPVSGHESAAGKPCSTECIHCHQTYDPGVAHQGLHPCSDKCKKCDEPITAIAQHTRLYECSATCKWCDEPMPAGKAHAGLHDCSATCKYGCGTAVTPKAAHAGGCTDTICATCGSTIVPVGHKGAYACSDKCAGCGAALTNPGAHTPGDWTTTKAATETEEGEQKRSCTVCNKVIETRALDKLALSDPNAAGTGEGADSASGGGAVLIVVIVAVVVVAAGGAAAAVVVVKKKKSAKGE